VVVEIITLNPLQNKLKEVSKMANNTELLIALAQALGIDFPSAQSETTTPAEPLYIIYVGKKPRRVKAPYIAINANGELSGFTEEADVLGHGTDNIGKFTLAEIEERFPQFNHEAFLVKVED
jgi:hypothetical protein